MTNLYSLSQLGWQVFFQQQLSLDEWEQFRIGRIFSQQRSQLGLLTETGVVSLAVTSTMPAMTVGDWLLFDEAGHYIRLLDRLSLFSRKAAGAKVASQLIAANIDTAFIVSSMNQDFNLNRIERYLALVRESDVEPVVVLSKMDCCDKPQYYIDQVQDIDSMLMVVALNSLEPDSVKKLEPWCDLGKTLVFLGSSGVGKSTLINTLMGEGIQDTAGIRGDDGKGRHTTTGRSLHLLPSGALLMDTPGMRELQLADCEYGIEQTFDDIVELSSQCKFSDCQHQQEPGCAVGVAIERGELDERRLLNYQKLLREQLINSESLAEKRARGRSLSRMYRTVQAENQQLKRKE